MYEEYKKAIYGTLEASKIFWGKLSKSLEKLGYQRNKYYCCWMKKNPKVNSAPYSGMLKT